jgi:glycosyltransferase involved in cell wall biosynthesis
MPISKPDLASRAEKQSSQVEKHLMLFSPWCYGHYPSYLKYLIDYWCQRQLSETLSIIVSPEFMREHADVVILATNCDRIQFVSMTQQEQRDLESKTSGWSRAFEQYSLIAKYAERLKATQTLAMYFDSCQLPLAIGFKLPCSFSGIYFRPTFHYNRLPNYISTWKDRLRQLREKFFLSRLSNHPQLNRLFCLDPIVVDAINNLSDQAKAVCLADPIQVEQFSSERVMQFKTDFGIESDRRILLSFGRLTDPRKGIPQLIEAISLLPSELCQKVCLLFAGEPKGIGEKTLESWLESIRRALPVQIITRYGYVPESDVQLYFQISDAIAAPYQKHVGMSGILLQAAAVQKPVISSNYGLMGEMVRRYSLGLTVDTTNSVEIAEGLTQLILEPVDKLCDRERMKSFVQQNSAEQFAKTIFRQLLATSC